MKIYDACRWEMRTHDKQEKEIVLSTHKKLKTQIDVTLQNIVTNISILKPWKKMKSFTITEKITQVCIDPW